ncbi:His-Xaa-Ser system radical SAM maturase HxsB [Candidatus Parcubacteria bacterium]|nr:His-Xaa-Ser system radical SAM maturase HxsB [Candidatus Parcubacteria bacterium]
MKKKNLGFFRYKKINNNILLTNEVGNFCFLSLDDFKKFIYGQLDSKSKIYQVLKNGNFIKNKINEKVLINDYRRKNSFLAQGPSLHIIVLTKRCDHVCTYCQASAKINCDKKYDMDARIAKKTVDMIFQTTNRSISIEFQGGEPLLNWEILKFITDYSIEKNKHNDKDIRIHLMSNFGVMDQEKLNFLAKRRVGLSTSLDAPEQVHNKNRIFPGAKNSYQNAVKWIKKANKIYKKEADDCMPGVVNTITRDSFPFYREMVDENLSLDFEGVYIRPLSPFGTAQKTWKEIGYTPEEYLDYYKNVLDYIIKINLEKKIEFYERGTFFILLKILSKIDPNDLDMRSPCGAGIGQLLYNYDGKVYTCDEGRMIKDDTFMIGNVDKSSYEEMVGSDIVKSMCVASCLDGLQCDRCVYKPYCGVCPVYNYAQHGTLFPQLSCNNRCKINMGIFDYLFKKLEDEEVRKVFESWVKKY